VHTEVDMAAPDSPARVNPFFYGLTRQWTEVMCPTAVDNLERVECDCDLPPALHKRVGKDFWYSVEHEVPVHALITALELVGDKTLSHHQSQPSVHKEPRGQCLPRGTGKGGKRKRGGDGKPGDTPPPLPPKPKDPSKPKPILRARTTRVYPTLAAGEEE